MRLTLPQVLGIVALLGIAGAVKWQYGRRSRGDREKLEAIESENEAVHADRMKRIEQMKQNARAMRTGIPSCDALADMQQNDQPACKNAAARTAIEKLLAGSLDRMGAAKSAADMGVICQQVLDEVATERGRCGT